MAKQSYSELDKLLLELKGQNILFQDGNHFSAEVREAFTSGQKILKGDGNHAILLEGPMENNGIADHLNTLDHNEALAAISSITPYHTENPELHQRYIEAQLGIYNLDDDTTDIIYADRRYENHTALDALYKALEVINKHHIEIKLDDPYLDARTKKIIECLPQEDRDALKGLEEFGEFLADNRHNYQISETFNDLSSNAHTKSGLYGTGHFLRENDLDENLNAVNIALVEKPGNFMIKMLMESDKQLTDFPDYVFYTSENRVVKLDTPEARAEYLGTAPVIIPEFTCSDVLPGYIEPVEIDAQILPHKTPGKGITP